MGKMAGQVIVSPLRKGYDGKGVILRDLTRVHMKPLSFV